MAQLGLYAGLFQLFVADKISHKGCFTLQARCPEMDFLEGGEGMTLRMAQGHRPQGWPQAAPQAMVHITPYTSGRSSVPRCPTFPGPHCPSPRSTGLQPSL